ncbi:hypothetical protein BDK51DRAFT_50244 [Blyttiomyces helicus]|uniref:Uncharacterized protein n=1 Tax=Blyttiomyces helicus TaxID=388810 RepID=A0A4P9VXZ9_9FUNG|nr:hypothetical protein BDK51DRAFT_50244 [Blyttiomyces helicus]|eukprot:RKO83168.1 hypothetical protein BDK51DRAFT_50244 [Blyttiomyces helicus]
MWSDHLAALASGSGGDSTCPTAEIGPRRMIQHSSRSPETRPSLRFAVWNSSRTRSGADLYGIAHARRRACGQPAAYEQGFRAIRHHACDRPGVFDNEEVYAALAQQAQLSAPNMKIHNFTRGFFAGRKDILSRPEMGNGRCQPIANQLAFPMILLIKSRKRGAQHSPGFLRLVARRKDNPAATRCFGRHGIDFLPLPPSFSFYGPSLATPAPHQSSPHPLSSMRPVPKSHFPRKGQSANQLPRRSFPLFKKSFAAPCFHTLPQSSSPSPRRSDHMSLRIICTALALAATVATQPLAPLPIRNRSDAVYQAYADHITNFIAANGCGGNGASNPVTGRVLPPIWLRFIAGK